MLTVEFPLCISFLYWNSLFLSRGFTGFGVCSCSISGTQRFQWKLKPDQDSKTSRTGINKVMKNLMGLYNEQTNNG